MTEVDVAVGEVNVAGVMTLAHHEKNVSVATYDAQGLYDIAYKWCGRVFAWREDEDVPMLPVSLTHSVTEHQGFYLIDIQAGYADGRGVKAMVMVEESK